MVDEQEFMTWLLNAKTPSIRYQALVDLPGFPADEPRLVEARQAIMTRGPAPAILGRQSGTGNWSGERSFYTPKYVSTHWSMLLLAELNAEGGEARFQRGVEYMLDASSSRLSKRLEAWKPGWSCFWGNLLRYTLHASMDGDDRVEAIIHYTLLDLQDGPCRCENNWNYPCAWGVVRTLWGLAALPKAQCTPEIEAAIVRGVSFLLDSSHLVEADYPSSDKSPVNPLWFKLNFPLFYQVDILFTLRVLDELGMLKVPGAQPALDWLAQRRGRNGRWRGASPYRGRTWRELGDREETDRWVSLQSARILYHAGRIPAFQAVG